ncbi:uncharacterized protein LOC113360665 [Papaver somniferum]|uniref:uncharacterized protein LOC113360665 n=1 Tax=Papaver somniferum TaxID=3469 RepID=UPI000E6F980B|nr:uncharacterized protein LOC113360665 [Papaver somniferum]
MMNKSLHAKWIWRYGNERKALWRKVVRYKFGGNKKDFLPNSTSKSVGKSLWADILKCRSHVEQNCNMQVNSGDIVLFWKDVWLNGQYLQVLFPNLYSLSRLQDATIQEVLNVNAGNSWNFAFCRILKEVEVEDVAHLLDMLSTFNSGVGEDHRIWQDFSMSECYKSLEDDGLLVFPHKSLWDPKIP